MITPEPNQPNALRDWLSVKVSDAEKALKMREDMARVWRTGTNAEWDASTAMHSSTAGQNLSKADRLKQADMHDNIAVKLRHELEMFRALQSALTPPAVEKAATDGTPRTEASVANDAPDSNDQYVCADFARTLERETTELKQQLATALRDKDADKADLEYRGSMVDSWRKSYEQRLNEVFQLKEALAATLRDKERIAAIAEKWIEQFVDTCEGLDPEEAAEVQADRDAARSAKEGAL